MQSSYTVAFENGETHEQAGQCWLVTFKDDLGYTSVLDILKSHQKIANEKALIVFNENADACTEKEHAILESWVSVEVSNELVKLATKGCCQ